jgi:hypothetical protein
VHCGVYTEFPHPSTPHTPGSDPRRAFALSKAVPFVSFILSSTHSTPQIQVLYCPTDLKAELLASARLYIQLNVSYDVSQCTVLLPSTLDVYWRDFCTVKSELVKSIISFSSKKMADDLQIIFDSKKMKIIFSSAQGNPTLII